MTTKATVERITPADAGRMLENNTNNRGLSEKRVRQLAAAMGRGEWQDNGESIKMNGARLLDGQHRLAAVVMSKKSQRFTIVRGVTDDAMSTIDIGSARKVADYLKLRGETDVNHLAASLRSLWYLEECEGPIRLGGSLDPTPQQVLGVLDRHPQVREFVRSNQPGKWGVQGMPQGIFNTTAYVTHLAEPTEGAAFISGLISGVGLSVGDPVLVLRERLLQEKERSGMSRLKPIVVWAFAAKAWNAHLAEERMERLVWKENMRKKAHFPRFLGLEELFDLGHEWGR